jgi:hypothetical protein
MGRGPSWVVMIEWVVVDQAPNIMVYGRGTLWMRQYKVYGS